MAWRKIHFHEKDKWTGEVKEIVWLWKAVGYRGHSVCMKSPDGKVMVGCVNDVGKTPKHVKSYIEKLRGIDTSVITESKTLKHTDLETVNFGVLIRDLHKKSPIRFDGISEVFQSLKIDTGLITKAWTILGDLDVIEREETDEHTFSRRWVIKDPALIYG